MDETALEQKALPDGWRWARLGGVCAPTETRDPRRDPDTTFQYIDISSVDNLIKRITESKEIVGRDAPSRARQVIRAGDVIVSTTRPNLNAVALVPRELDNQICSTGFCVLRPSEQLDPSYLFAFVQTPELVNTLSDSVKGALYPAVTDGQVRAVTIPLPPISEQRRIAARLNEIMAEIARARVAAQAALDAATAIPGALLRVVFESDEAKTWEQRTISDVCREITDGTHVTPAYMARGVPFLSVKDIKETGISFDNCRFISEEQHRDYVKRCKPERGDVLYTKVGTTGIAKAVDVDREFSIFVSIALLKLRSDIMPSYLEMVLNSPLCRAQAAHLTQGMANRNLVLQDLKRIVLPVPSVLEQKRILVTLQADLDVSRRLRKAIQGQLDAINALPAVYLRRAFNGEL